MFLFRMHSVGSIRPRLSVSDAIIRMCENDEPAVTKEVCPSAEIEEDVVVIQEEEMVLVRKESPDSSPVQAPVQEEDVSAVEAAVVEAAVVEAAVVEAADVEAPKEQGPTVSSKPKSKKKKQQKRR
jgi:hypothetical protein